MRCSTCRGRGSGTAPPPGVQQPPLLRQEKKQFVARQSISVVVVTVNAPQKTRPRTVSVSRDSSHHHRQRERRLHPRPVPRSGRKFKVAELINFDFSRLCDPSANPEDGRSCDLDSHYSHTRCRYSFTQRNKKSAKDTKQQGVQSRSLRDALVPNSRSHV
ncbi:hypothetical protein TcasGA2_TC032537 [Tribolium castaneum]|uniref:Uncharacterized protein n=1 Tax=Tribolium castaneum TaxID=7070 RepID=A0A139WKL5_TRICA|nr:hypothetical protein TcasGA2_TC032537 [Tribolium castaneum]